MYTSFFVFFFHLFFLHILLYGSKQTKSEHTYTDTRSHKTTNTTHILNTFIYTSKKDKLHFVNKRFILLKIRYFTQ